MEDTRAMLDALMGGNRNLSKKDAKQTSKRSNWWDDEYCKNFLAWDMCPHDLFTNAKGRAITKAPIPECSRTHCQIMKAQFKDHPEYEKCRRRFLQDLDKYMSRQLVLHETRINNEKERLNKGESGANEANTRATSEVETRESLVKDKLMAAEEMANSGEVEVSKSVFDEAMFFSHEQKRWERLKESSAGWIDEICEICGAYMSWRDPEELRRKENGRPHSHVVGTMHTGWQKFRESYERLQDEIKKIGDGPSAAMPSEAEQIERDKHAPARKGNDDRGDRRDRGEQRGDKRDRGADEPRGERRDRGGDEARGERRDRGADDRSRRDRDQHDRVERDDRNADAGSRRDRNGYDRRDTDDNRGQHDKRERDDRYGDDRTRRDRQDYDRRERDDRGGGGDRRSRRESFDDFGRSSGRGRDARRGRSRSRSRDEFGRVIDSRAIVSRARSRSDENKEKSRVVEEKASSRARSRSHENKEKSRVMEDKEKARPVEDKTSGQAAKEDKKVATSGQAAKEDKKVATSGQAAKEDKKVVTVDFSVDWEDVMNQKFEDLKIEQEAWVMRCFDSKSKPIDLGADVVEIVRSSFPLRFEFIKR